MQVCKYSELPLNSELHLRAVKRKGRPTTSTSAVSGKKLLRVLPSVQNDWPNCLVIAQNRLQHPSSGNWGTWTPAGVLWVKTTASQHHPLCPLLHGSGGGPHFDREEWQTGMPCRIRAPAAPTACCRAALDQLPLHVLLGCVWVEVVVTGAWTCCWSRAAGDIAAAPDTPRAARSCCPQCPLPAVSQTLFAIVFKIKPFCCSSERFTHLRAVASVW
mgnify:CR=1 FL=1